MTAIEWTDVTWNPSVGCSRVSAGCEHCYAERVAHRAMQPAHEGLTVMGKHGPRWNGTVRFLPERLATPLRWRKPRRVFVDSMSDLFHEGVTNEQIASVFGVMAACPTHTFQVLTKRPERAREWFAWLDAEQSEHAPPHTVECGIHAANHGADVDYLGLPATWPLPNVWLGVSVEDQPSADKRIRDLLMCPAAVHFVSQEPQLGAVLYQERWLRGLFDHCPIDGQEVDGMDPCDGCPGYGDECAAVRGPRLGWIIIGGESGPGARPFDLAWARSTIAQCREAGVACFVKQLGAWPGVGSIDSERDLRDALALDAIRDRKGGEMSEWPEDLRVREFPGRETRKA